MAMKQLITAIIFSLFALNLFANKYVITFKDGGTGNDKTQKLTSTAPTDYIFSGDELVSSVSSTNCYLAKSGFGLKFGTASAFGSITLDLTDTYQPTQITITAAAYPFKADSADTKAIAVNNQNIYFTNGAQLTDYVIAFDGSQSLSSLTITGLKNPNNRFYITQITIEAPDPAPLRGKISGDKKLDFGAEHLVNGQVQTIAELEFTASSLSQDITLSLSDPSNCFSLSTTTLPKEGGIVQVYFSSSHTGKYNATLTLASIGLDDAVVSVKIPISINVCSEIYHSGDIDDPYTVQDALARIEELADNETTTQWWYIKGFVASDISTSQSTGGLTFDLKWDNSTIYVYALLGENGTSINAQDLHLNDTILIYSRLQKYVSYNQSHNEVYMGYLVNSDVPVIDWRELQPGYYDELQSTAYPTLKQVLGQIISGGIRYTYGSGSLHTWDGFYYTDREQNSMLVLDMYSNNQRYFSEQNPTASVTGLDIEHIFPKSWWGGTVNDAYKDLYHLVPADYSANRSKGNDGPGDVEVASFDNGSFKIGTPTYDSPAPRVFEPADEYKGDFARAYFYIITAYSGLDWDMTTPAQYFLDPASELLLQPWLTRTLLKWHRQDPVSNKEIERAKQVSRIQHNRNPFIDYPCLVEYIWGDKQTEQVDMQALLFTATDEYQTTEDKSGCTCTCEPVPSEVQQTQGKQPSAKIIMTEGKLLIIHNGQQYTITGQHIK